MEPIETRQRFLANLKELGLDPDHLDPWSGWQAFKEFLKLEVWDFYDAASVQVRPEGSAGCMFFVRQFTQRDDGSSHAADVLMGRLIVEFQFDSRAVPEQEVWTLDYPTLTEWAAVIEGEPWFQALVNQEPTFSDVYYDAAD